MNKLNERKEATISKILFFSIIQCLSFILSFVYVIFVFQDSNSFFVSLTENNPLLTAAVQAKRAWAIFGASIYLLSTILIFWNLSTLKKQKEKSLLIFFLCLLPFLNLITSIIWIKKEKVYKYWIQNYEEENDFHFMLTLPVFLKTLFNKTKNKKRDIWFNVLVYFVFLLCLLAFIVNTIIIRDDDSYNVYNYYIFKKVGYFSQLTNTLCFIYVIYFLIFKESIAIKNNDVKIALASYIAVVSTIYIAIVVPGKELFDLKQDNSIIGIISGFNQHITVPIFFIWFICILFKKEKLNSSNFLYISLKSNIYPIWYLTYSYSISFVCRYSPYYITTNMNPNMTLYDSGKQGNYINVLIGVSILFYFMIWYFVFWSINIKMKKDKIRDQLKWNF